MASPAESAVTVSRPIVSSNLETIKVKLVLLGESAVGKSSIALRFVNRDYIDNSEPTIGAAYLMQKCRVNDRLIQFDIWDTAGQERFHSLAPMYYRNARAAIVVYDITKSSTFSKAKSWVKELQRQANPDIVIALVGNKSDLAEKPSEEEVQDEDEDEHRPLPERQVLTEDAQAYAEESGLLFFETSAKTAKNIDHTFHEIAKNIPLDIVATGRMDNRGLRNANGSVDLMRSSLPSGSSGQCAC